MDLVTVLKVGLIAAVPVAVACAVLLFVRADVIDDVKDEGPALGFSSDGVVCWVLTWAAITLAFGVAAALVYDRLSSRWDFGPSQYLFLAIVVAVTLSAMLFVRIYEGETHVFRVEYTAMNFIYAVGFGTLVPWLAG